MFKKVTKDAILPTRESKYSAAVDVYAAEDVTIGAGETKLVGLGIAIDINNLLENVPTVKAMKRWFKKNFNNTNPEVSEDKSLYPIKDEFLKSHYLQLTINDSLAAKGLMLSNGIGVINLDNKNEIKIIIHNLLKLPHIVMTIEKTALTTRHSYRKPYTIKKGERIGQIALLEHKSSLFGIESKDRQGKAC